jgi:hypothetical protein
MESDAQSMMGLVTLRLVVFLTLGTLLGYAYLALLNLNVRLYVVDGWGWFALVIHFMRVIMVVVAFAFCALRSAPALISSVIGFQITRTVAIHQMLALEKKQ